MKIIKSTFSIIMYLFVVLLINSCSNNPSVLEVVPKTSPTVSIINVGSLLQKGHLDNIEEFKFFKKIKRFVSQDDESRKLYKAIEEDPSITGVDFLGDLVIFNHLLSEKNMYNCFAFELKSSDKFKKFLLDSFGKSKKKFEIKNKDGISYVILESGYINVTLSWDDNKALFMYSSNYGNPEKEINIDAFVDLMKLKTEDNITNNENYSKFLANRKDVSTWSSLENYKSYMMPEFRLLKKFLGFNPNATDSEDDKSSTILDKEIYFSSHLDFDNEFIKYSGDVTSKESFKEFDIYNKDFNLDILKYVPKESYFLAGISLDVTKGHDLFGTHKQYEKIMKEAAKEFKVDPKALINSFGGSAVFNVHGVDKVKYSYLGYGYSLDESKATKLDKEYPIKDIVLNSSEIDKLNNGETITVSGGYNMNIKNILANGGTYETALKNNVSVSYYEGGMVYNNNIEKTIEKELPLFTFVTDIKDSKVITELFSSEDFSKEFSKEDGYYKSKGRDLVYISIQNKTILLTNDINVLEKHKTGGFSENLGASSLASNLSTSPFYASMNFDYDTYSEEVKNSLELEFKKGFTAKPYTLVFDFIKTIELKTSSESSAEFIINTQKTDENSFYNLIKTIDDGVSDML